MKKSRSARPSVTNTAKRVAATMAAAATLASGAALVLAGPASAATNPLVVCAKGTYDAYVVLPDRGGLTGANVQSGTCMTFDFGSRTGVENIEVRGYVGPHGAGAATDFHVATGAWRPSKGGTVTALGTVENHTAHFPLL